MSDIKNIVQLRKELCSAYLWVKDDPRRANQVKEMANTAGKIIASCMVQLEYSSLRKEKPNIPFLDE